MVLYHCCHLLQVVASSQVALTASSAVSVSVNGCRAAMNCPLRVSIKKTSELEAAEKRPPALHWLATTS